MSSYFPSLPSLSWTLEILFGCMIETKITLDVLRWICRVLFISQLISSHLHPASHHLPSFYLSPLISSTSSSLWERSPRDTEYNSKKCFLCLINMCCFLIWLEEKPAYSYLLNSSEGVWGTGEYYIWLYPIQSCDTDSSEHTAPSGQCAAFVLFFCGQLSHTGPWDLVLSFIFFLALS